MMSLVNYIASFVVVIGIVTATTNFFNNNIRDLSSTESISQEYNKFNLYMLKFTKNGYSADISSDNTVIIFSKSNEDISKITFLNNTIYFNKIKLCENIDSVLFQKISAGNGKDVLKTTIQINGEIYNTDYVLE